MAYEAFFMEDVNGPQGIDTFHFVPRDHCQKRFPEEGCDFLAHPLTTVDPHSEPDGSFTATEGAWTPAFGHHSGPHTIDAQRPFFFLPMYQHLVDVSGAPAQEGLRPLAQPELRGSLLSQYQSPETGILSPPPECDASSVTPPDSWSASPSPASTVHVNDLATLRSQDRQQGEIYQVANSPFIDVRDAAASPDFADHCMPTAEPEDPTYFSFGPAPQAKAEEIFGDACLAHESVTSCLRRLREEPPFENVGLPAVSTRSEIDDGEQNETRIVSELEPELGLESEPRIASGQNMNGLEVGTTNSDGKRTCDDSAPDHAFANSDSGRQKCPRKNTNFSPSSRSDGATARRGLHCPDCRSRSSFRDEAALRKHMRTRHTRPYVCVFSFAGCPSSFPSKNEWKRHVGTQHLALHYWLCTEDGCRRGEGSGSLPQPGSAKPSSTAAGWTAAHGLAHPPPDGAVFNRKDLYTEHVRRMHMPLQAQVVKAARREKPTPACDERMKRLQAEAVRRRCDLPSRMVCPATGCRAEFRGCDAWDRRMEHVAKHLERAAEGHEGAVSQGGDGDPTLTLWAESPEVGVIRRVGGQTWELLNPLKDSAIGWVEDSKVRRDRRKKRNIGVVNRRGMVGLGPKPR